MIQDPEDLISQFLTDFEAVGFQTSPSNQGMLEVFLELKLAEITVLDTMKMPHRDINSVLCAAILKYGSNLYPPIWCTKLTLIHRVTESYKYTKIILH